LPLSEDLPVTTTLPLLSTANPLALPGLERCCQSTDPSAPEYLMVTQSVLLKPEVVPVTMMSPAASRTTLTA
jgi:hypothetical protein